jgi:hypothetical protein
MICSTWPASAGPPPPGLHDPLGRPRVDRWGEWEVRFGGDGDILQLWALRGGASVLLPAPGNPAATITPAGWHVLTATDEMVRALLRNDRNLELPSPRRMLLAERWFLRGWPPPSRVCELAIFRPGIGS